MNAGAVLMTDTLFDLAPGQIRAPERGRRPLSRDRRRTPLLPGRSTMTAPYWSDDTCALYVGDMREVLPALGITADLIVADPPYGETSLAWDRWPDGWLQAAAVVASSMWCFGSLRMFLDRRDEFADWNLSQDVVWEKHNGSGFTADRFKRVHEFALHWYQGPWRALHRQVPRIPAADQGDHRTRYRRGTNRFAHTGEIGDHEPQRRDGTRMIRSVIKARNLNGSAIHPSQKPVDLLRPLIEYACPPGGLVVDPFAGSGSTLEAARLSGRRAIGIEANEKYAAAAARRLSQQPMEITDVKKGSTP